jgi:hypothetical protein
MNAFLKGFVSMFDWMFPRTVDEQLQDLYDDMHWGMYKNLLEESKVDNWVRIDDEKVRQDWECPECGGWVKVHPNEYEDIGTPSCGECDCDMVYNYTEIFNG